MIALDVAVDDYRERCRKSSVADYPMAWVGHYSEEKLGELGLPAPLPDLGQAILAMLSPFAISLEVTTSVLIVDGASVPDYQRVLFVIQLAALRSGHLTMTPYEIPYTVTDQGTELGKPEKEWYRAQVIYKAASAVFDWRIADKTKHPFDDAYMASVERLREMA